MTTADSRFVQVDGLSRSFPGERGGEALTVFEQVNFAIARGEFICVIGHSGCGKSTILNILAGLDQPSQGVALMEGREIAGPSLDRGVIFQNHSLLPWLTVYDNVRLAVTKVFGAAKSRAEQHDWIMANLDLVQMTHAADKRPGEISGGMRQRVGLARALAAETDILLMDEAFSALDPLIRREMQDQLIDLQGKLGKTILFITHDLNEAMRLGDRIAMMRDGRVEQVGTAEEILRDPASDYVSRFVADVDRTRVLTAGSIAEPPYAVLGSDRSPRAAHKLLRENQPPWLLVQNRDRTPFGYVWEDDVARAVKEGSDVLPLSTIHEMPVVAHSTPVNELFAHAAQHAAPIVVVDDDGRISGVIPRVTLLAAISEQNQDTGASSADPAGPDDDSQDGMAGPAVEQTDEQAAEASETTEAEGADA